MGLIKLPTARPWQGGSYTQSSGINLPNRGENRTAAGPRLIQRHRVSFAFGKTGWRPAIQFARRGNQCIDSDLGSLQNPPYLDWLWWQAQREWASPMPPRSHPQT